MPPRLTAIAFTALLLAIAPAGTAWGQRGSESPAREAARMPEFPAAQTMRARALDRVPVALPTGVSGRAIEAGRMLRRHRAVLDRDPAGAPVVRSEVVAIDPAPTALERARDAGFTVVSERALEELGLRLVVLRARAGMGTALALRTLRQLDPQGQYDFNHLYLGSASAASATTAASAAPGVSPGPGGLRIGLIDSGVARDHPALANVDVRAWGCDGKAVPDAHGTAVASLLAGNGSGPRNTLFAADIYCGQPTGGAVTGYVEAMAWLARQRVGVINLSLVGPHNALLQRATRALVDRGHLLVAAVGNDGPAAAPLFPAAYPGVIGVTAVDRRSRALPEAVRGAQVDFAALGVDLRAARPGGGWRTVRGTSFAAPLVARAAAALAPEPRAAGTDDVMALLAAQATDLGEQGRDTTYGHGLVAPLRQVADASGP